MKWIGHFLLGVIDWCFSLGITFGVLGVLLMVAVFHSYNKGLPDFSDLERYDPPTVTRLYAADGKLMAEYATEKRFFVPLKAIPKQVVHAFLSAEDKNFYSHTGVDITGMLRAVRNNIINYGQGKSLVGGSTITQQVVKNFLLTSEKSLERKIKEAILAVRITQVYSKDKILELYLNEIYLGMGSYGIAAAAQNYFGKSLEDLTLAEAALLAAQPKAPNLYHPKKNHAAALERRNWVITRMREDGHITTGEAEAARKEPIILGSKDVAHVVNAAFFSEEVRRALASMYGSNVLYEGGLVVKTTLNSTYQTWADDALQDALIAYDRRHGYRGPLGHISDVLHSADELHALEKQWSSQILPTQRLAMVKHADAKQARLIYSDGKEITLPAVGWNWTQAKKKPAPFVVGDVLLIALEGPQPELAQIPEVNGALVVADPHTGRVLAMSGGYSYGGTEFNRATQAKRQPGSAFKPFVYAAALENGLLPTSILQDAPIELSQGANQPLWKPQNYHDDYLGEITLRTGLEKSRNTITVRLAQMIGLDKCLEIGKRLGIYTDPPANLSIVLGTSETTLLQLVNAYGMIANGGKQITPSFIERIDDRHGMTLFRRDKRACEGCLMELGATMPPIVAPPSLPDTRQQVMDPRIAYQMTSLLEGVVQRGTATRALSIGKPVAGKTGTTNESYDTWFVGFSPNLVVGVYVGYDKPRSLGAKETGASVALPAFIQFMKQALKDAPAEDFPIPRGMTFVEVDHETGLPIDPTAKGARSVHEAFIASGPIFVPGVTSQAVLDAMNNLPVGFEPVTPTAATPATALPWQMPAPNMIPPPPVPPPGQTPAFEALPPQMQLPVDEAPGSLRGLY